MWPQLMCLRYTLVLWSASVRGKSFERPLRSRTERDLPGSRDLPWRKCGHGIILPTRDCMAIPEPSGTESFGTNEHVVGKCGTTMLSECIHNEELRTNHRGHYASDLTWSKKTVDPICTRSRRLLCIIAVVPLPDLCEPRMRLNRSPALSILICFLLNTCVKVSSASKTALSSRMSILSHGTGSEVQCRFPKSSTTRTPSAASPFGPPSEDASMKTWAERLTAVSRVMTMSSMSFTVCRTKCGTTMWPLFIFRFVNTFRQHRGSTMRPCGTTTMLSECY